MSIHILPAAPQLDPAASQADLRWVTPARNAPDPLSVAADGPPLHTPLVWAWGGALLTVTLWLTGIIALVRALAALFAG